MGRGRREKKLERPRAGRRVGAAEIVKVRRGAQAPDEWDNQLLPRRASPMTMWDPLQTRGMPGMGEYESNFMPITIKLS